MDCAPLNLTVRVGCNLAYDTTIPTPVLLVLKPRLEGKLLVVQEKLSFGIGVPAYEFQDSHGNMNYRSMLMPGRNEIRHGKATRRLLACGVSAPEKMPVRRLETGELWGKLGEKGKFRKVGIMNTTTAALPNRHTRGRGLNWVANGSMMEAFGAIATMALAIVGLAGVFSATLAAIATIIIGAAILMESDFFGAFWTKSGNNAHEMEALETPSAQFIGGLTGIVLGILALLGVAADTLLSVAILVYGATLLLSGAPNQSHWLAHASGGEVLIGLGTLVLGLLAVIGVDSLTLVLVALLCLGAAALFSRSAPAIRAATHS